ncbi:MAG: hypothetical protein QXW01_02955 [Candidatus Aenigmatarchaeota archaeon]
MEKRILILVIAVSVLIILILPILFYYLEEGKKKEKAINICIETCRNELLKGRDLFDGPCLLNPIEELPEWVCDVVNEPRQPIDDLKENQCSFYYERKAKHFVEVSTSCNLVRVV